MQLIRHTQHFFLQHLPSIPHLRSLSIPFLADHVHGANVDPRELALQIVDIVALRPEVEICYMGIANKCFEILENRRRGSSDSFDNRPESHLGLHTGHVDEDDAADGSDADDADEDDDGDGAHEDEEDGAEAEEDVDTESEDEDDDDEEQSEAGSEGGRGSQRLRLREILFYDDKVAIFKARHGRL